MQEYFLNDNVQTTGHKYVFYIVLVYIKPTILKYIIKKQTNKNKLNVISNKM